ncbi:MAG: hypothetical protein LBP59_12340 [Planctomycetaceae bacterium]|nr:hypothetical protein [Planctomycetaceae bacterium]
MRMRSIVLTFVFILAISFQIAKINAQSTTNDNGDAEKTVAATVASEVASDANLATSTKDDIDQNDLLLTLDLPPLTTTDPSTGATTDPSTGTTTDTANNITTNTTSNEENPAKIDGNKNTPDNSKPNATPNNEKNTNAEKNKNPDDVGISKSWNEWDKNFAPHNNNLPVPKGNLPPPPRNNYNFDQNNFNQNNFSQNQTANYNQYENKPIPYLAWHRDPWTHRLSLAPYAPGYAAAPKEFPIPPSDISLWMTNFPSHGNYWKQPQYLGYYDPMPEIVSATPSRSQMILGYPNTPQTQYRNPYTGQPSTFNPAINPESILPVRESLIERWRRRSIARRSAPLGQFPAQPPLYQQPTQSPLFGQNYEQQPYEQSHAQSYDQQNQQNEFYQNQLNEQQFQTNQIYLPQEQRYPRRPLGRFRQGLRDRIQRLGIFEALTQGRSTYNQNTNQYQNPNAAYGEAPAYDGTN